MIIYVGDFCYYGGEVGLVDFLMWYVDLFYEYRILIVGNYDFKVVEEREFFRSQLFFSIIYLEDEGVSIGGVNFWGLFVFLDLVEMVFGKE